MQDASNVTGQAEQVAAARWQAHTIDRAIRLLAFVALGVALAMVLEQFAPQLEEAAADA